MPSAFPAVFYSLNGRVPGAGFTTARDFDIASRGTRAASTLRFESQLVDAIRDSVRKCYRTSEDTFLSLSGGYDSCAILGALAAQRLDAQTFTYGRADPPRWSDVASAQETARRLAYPHAIWPMDRYSVNVVQRENARLFGFRANRCEELGAWLHFRDAIAPTLGIRPLFVFGDECFGWSDCAIRTEGDLLHSLGLVTGTALIEPFLDADTVQSVRDAYAHELARIVHRADHLKDWHDKKDYLYFHERLQKVILPWRQQFAASFGDVATPLLDPEVLRLVGSIPTLERRGKRLMRRAVRAAFPKAFARQRAVRSGAPILPLLSPWPAHLTTGDLRTACGELGLSPRFVDEVHCRTTDDHPRPSLASARQEAEAAIRAALKSALNNKSVTRAALSRLPPHFTYPSVELVLSRLQMWVLAFLESDSRREEPANSQGQPILPT